MDTKEILQKVLRTLNPAVARQKYPLKWTYWVTSVLLRFVYFTPLRWDQKGRRIAYVGWPQSLWTQIKWRFVVGCATAFTITAGLMGFGRLVFAHEERDDMLESFILTASITCCLVASVGIHNLAYSEDAIVLFQFWPAITEKLHNTQMEIREEEPMGDILCAVAIITVLFAIFLAPIMLTIPFLFNCDLGIVAFVLPICHDGSHASISSEVFYILLHMWLYSVMLNVMATYACVGMVVVVSAYEFCTEIGGSRLKPVYQRHEVFLRAYIYLHIIAHVVNEFLRVLLPVNYVYCAALMMASGFYIIRGNFGFFFRLFLVFGFLMPAADIGLTAALGGEHCAKVAELRRRQIHGGKPLSPYQRRCYAACPPIKIMVGNFVHVSRYTPLQLMYKIVDTLVTLLCATRAS